MNFQLRQLGLITCPIRATSYRGSYLHYQLYNSPISVDVPLFLVSQFVYFGATDASSNHIKIVILRAPR